MKHTYNTPEVAWPLLVVQLLIRLPLKRVRLVTTLGFNSMAGVKNVLLSSGLSSLDAQREGYKN